MAKDKNSFILYKDQRTHFTKLSNEDAGKLIKHIYSYISDENPTPESVVVDLSFEAFRLTLKRDLKKYNNIVERNYINGSKGGRPKKAKKPTGLNGLPNKPKKADSVSGNDSVNNNILLKDVSSPPNGVDILHFHIAKGFYNLFLKKGETKTLRKATVIYWVKIIRLLINEDEVSLEQLVAIKYYFEKCQNRDKNVKDWWFKNINSVAAFRKKNSDNEYHYDKITNHIKTWVESNPEVRAEIFVRTNKLKEQTK